MDRKLKRNFCYTVMMMVSFLIGFSCGVKAIRNEDDEYWGEF